MSVCGWEDKNNLPACPIAYLNAEDSSQYIGELLSTELDRRISPFIKTFGTNQYKTSVQLAMIAHILANAYHP